MRNLMLFSYLVFFAMLTACNSSSNTTPVVVTSSTYLGTSAPGDTWEVIYRSDGSFQVTNNTNKPDLVIWTGSYASLPSGFTKLTVNSTQAVTSGTPSPASPISPAEIWYAKTVPGKLTAVWNFGKTSLCTTTTDCTSGNAPIIAAVAGTCPSPSSETYNTVQIPYLNATWKPSDFLYGVLAVGTPTISFTETLNKLNGNSGTYSKPALSGITCESGVSQGSYAGPAVTDAPTIPANPTASILSTNSDLILRDDGINQGGSMGAKPIVGFDPAGLLTKTFVGFLAVDPTSGTDKTTAVKYTIYANNTPTNCVDVTGSIGCATGGQIDPETGNLFNSAAEGLRVISNTDGLLTGKYPNNAGNDAKVVVTSINGKFVLLGVSTNSNKPVNMMLVEEP